MGPIHPVWGHVLVSCHLSQGTGWLNTIQCPGSDITMILGIKSSDTEGVGQQKTTVGARVKIDLGFHEGACILASHHPPKIQPPG